MARITLLPAACPVCDLPATRAVHQREGLVHEVLRCSEHGRLAPEGLTVAAYAQACAA